MSSILELDASSDSEDDCDYVPPKGAASESEDSSGTDLDEESPKSKKMKLDNPSKMETKPIEEKKNVDEIWKSFLSGVETVKRVESEKKTTPSCETCSCPQQENDVKDTKMPIENVVPKENTPSLSELNEVNKTPLSLSKSVVSPNLKLDTCNKTENHSNESQSKPVLPLPSKSGLNSLLGKIANKGKKMTVLEKSLNDWKTFKQQEGIEEDLLIYNKGKQGFLERQRFLERSDLRSYETEKSIRLGKKK